jgi:hypothetical protein
VSDSAREASLAELEAALDAIRAAPKDAGTVEMIVRRPASNEREVLVIARLEPGKGLVGDRFGARKPIRGEPLTLMNSRVAALVARDRSRWQLAGDQLYVDLDLSGANLPPRTLLSVGGALIEVSAEPHTGCGKFRERFGADALRFVSSAVGNELQLRGINAHIVSAGDVRVGDLVRKL